MRTWKGVQGHDDPVVDAFMRDADVWAKGFEGDLVTFDHPEGIPADAPFDVGHELGEAPGGFALVDPGYTGKGCYATSEDREKWSDSTITVRSADPSNKNIVIRVRRRFDA